MKHKITEVTEGCVKFSDGSSITSYHSQQCCEYNYADFKQIEDEVFNRTFDLAKLTFERCDRYGFRFGDSPLNMWFIPCYSEQNGYYSNDLDIFYNGVRVLQVSCEEIY